MEYNISTLSEQEELIQKLSERIIGKRMKYPICILKPDDEVSLHTFMDQLYHPIMGHKTDTLQVYSDYCKEDSIDSQGENGIAKDFLRSFQISLSFVSYAPSLKEENFQILSSKDDVVFLIKYWEANSTITKEMILKVLRDADSLEKDFKKKIYLILVYDQELSHIIEKLNKDAAIINFHKLSVTDAKRYLQDYADNSTIEQHTAALYSTLGGNLNIILKYIKLLEGSPQTGSEINTIIENAIQETIGNIKKELDVHYMESLNYLSIMPKYLDPFELRGINENLALSEIENLIDVLEKLSVLYPVDDIYYFFLTEIKKEILNMHKGKKETLSKNYYKHIKKKHPLDYLMRARFLQSMKYPDNDILSLYILALGTAFRKNNKYMMEEIKKLVENSVMNEACVQDFQKVYKMYKDYIDSEYKIKVSFYDEAMEFFKSNLSELIRSEFLKNDILRFAPEYKVGDLLEKYCKLLIKILLSLDHDSYMYEKAHYATCIMILLPHLKDKFNDENSHNLLENKLREIEKNDSILKQCMIYHKNIMLRKSFMNENLDVAIDNSNQALRFFKSENDISEQYMTLSGLIGLFTANAQFDRAQKAYEEIQTLGNNYQDCFLPQYYKTENNKIILDFLYNEERLSISDIKEIMKSLLDIRDANNVSKAVIYTNLAALSLYIDEIDMYENYKKLLENHLNYDDCSDLEDSTVDDFYAYYFGWFEFGKAIMQGKHEEAKNRYHALSDFIPTIFKQHEIIFKDKHKKYKDVLDKTLTGKEFALFAIKQKRSNHRSWNFFSRGFMVSDLQHSSFY